MYFSNTLLRGFGKFNNKSLDLKQGINVISGSEDSGKTTFKDFLIGMLFGIPQRSGITKVRSSYEDEKPRTGNSYGGTVYIKKDEKSYLVERDFIGAGKTSVLDVNSGRDVRLDKTGSLTGAIIETDRNSYIASKVISEMKAETSEEGEKEITKFLHNMILTGTRGIDYESAISYLQDQKKRNIPKPLVRRLNQLDLKMSQFDGIDNEIDQVDKDMKKLNEDFIVEAEKRKRVARRLVENEDGSVTYQEDEKLDEKMDRLTKAEHDFGAEDEEKDNEEDKKITDRVPVIIGAGIAVILIVAAVVYLLPFENIIRKLFIVFTAFSVTFTIIDGFRIKGFFDVDEDLSTPDEEEFNKVLKELQEESEEKEELEFDMNFAKEYQEKKSVLQEKEKKLLEKRTERNKLKHEFDAVFKKKSELEDEGKAINFAIVKIEELSEKFMKDAENTILPHLSDFLPLVTDNKFNGIRFEGSRIYLNGCDGEVRPGTLTMKELRKVYLAIRLAVAKNMIAPELPIIIDSAIDFANETEAASFAAIFKKFKEEQIIILTSDKDMSSKLLNVGIENTSIEL